MKEKKGFVNRVKTDAETEVDASLSKSITASSAVISDGQGGSFVQPTVELNEPHPEMEEVMYTPPVPHKNGHLNDINLLNAIRDLAGRAYGDVEASLAKHVTAGDAHSVRVLRVGQAYSQEVVDGRINVLLDGTGQVLELTVG